MMVRAALVALAVAAALIPMPATAVESWYSTAFYPRLQSLITPATNLIPIALLDVAVLLLLAILGLRFVTAVRHTSLRAALTGALRQIIVIAAVAYLLFLGMWGLNYRRVPLERKLDYDAARLTREAGLQFASTAARLANERHQSAHASVHDPASLARGFAEAQRLLGASRGAATGVPKRSTLGAYFRRAAIDGMTDPFFLEIILNPDLLEVERPFVMAHEWAHLAGYADESEANFVAWLTCIRGDAAAQYSGWLAAYQHALDGVPRGDRRLVTALAEGPRQDLRAVAARYHRSSELVRTAARDVYDSYLKANRVAEGIANYDAVLRLMLGSTFDQHWTPRLRGE
jgi:hypothetical protein